MSAVVHAWIRRGAVVSFFRWVLAAIAIAAAGQAVAQDRNEASALHMVQTLRLGENLSAMSFKMAQATVTYQGILMKVGPHKAEEMLRAELAQVVPRYQGQWNQNLAKAWAPLMTPAEFDSIAQLRQSSPHARKFLGLQKDAGANMRALSEKLLATVIAEALEPVFMRVSRQP